MSIKMSKNVKEERYRWVKPIIDKEIAIVDLAKVCPYSESSLKRWLKAFREGGTDALEPKSTEPKTQPKETPIWVKERLIEIDVKYVPGSVEGKRYYQYTAIDTSSRWRYLAIYDEQSSFHSIRFLKEVIERFQYKILAIKTDNGSIFTNYYVGSTRRSDLTMKTNHTLDRFCAEQGIVHYLIDPGKPAQNGTVERSHREDEEKIYQQNIFKNSNDLKRKLKRWNIKYNNLEHCGLQGKTPLEILDLFKLQKVSKEVS